MANELNNELQVLLAFSDAGQAAVVAKSEQRITKVTAEERKAALESEKIAKQKAAALIKREQEIEAATLASVIKRGREADKALTAEGARYRKLGEGVSKAGSAVTSLTTVIGTANPAIQKMLMGFGQFAGLLGTGGPVAVAATVTVAAVASVYKAVGEMNVRLQEGYDATVASTTDLYTKLQAMRGKAPQVTKDQTEAAQALLQVTTDIAAKEEKIASLRSELGAFGAKVITWKMNVASVVRDELRGTEDLLKLDQERLRLAKELAQQAEKNALLADISNTGWKPGTTPLFNKVWASGLGQGKPSTAAVTGVATEMQEFRNLLVGNEGLKQAWADFMSSTGPASQNNMLSRYFADAAEAAAALNVEMKSTLLLSREVYTGLVGESPLMPGSVVTPLGGVNDPQAGARRTPSGAQHIGSALGGAASLADLGGVVGGAATAAGAAPLAAGLAGAAIPAALGALASAFAAAATAPFTAAGFVAGRLITDGIIGKLTGIGDAIFEAVMGEDPVAKIREYIGDAFKNFDAISENIGPVLDEIIFALPLMLERAMTSLVGTLVSVMDRSPALINSIIAGLSKALTVLMANLPKLIKSAAPMIAQGIALAIAFAIGAANPLITVGPIILAAIATALVQALLDWQWGSMVDAFTSTLGGLFIAALTPVIDMLNTWIDGINSVFKTTIPHIPHPQWQGYATDASAYGTGGGDDGSGGATTNPTMPERNDLPVFHGGGYVDSIMAANQSRAGNVLALLRPGEGVLNPDATARMGGPQGIEAINDGRSAGGRVEVTVNLVGHTMETARVLVRDVLLPELARLGNFSGVSLQGHQSPVF